MRIYWFCFIFLMSLNLGAQPTELNIMSFNIRYPNPDDGENYWPNRKDKVASMITYHEADIIGLQEAFKSQMDELKGLLPGHFAFFGVCRTDGSTNPSPDNEFSSILYRKDKFELLEGNTFWLSETPEEVGKAGWDAALPRIVTWAKFKDRNNGKIFFHFNTHFDHQGKTARANSAKLILDRIETIAGDHPVILTGDFNCIPEDEPYQILIDENRKGHLYDAYFMTYTPPHGPNGTWTNSFEVPGVEGRRIDYIFIKNQVKVLKHGILSDSWGGQLPSDHLPVIAKISF